MNSIDLSAASQVHIVEPHWNPMAEAQAVDRVHRIGQTKEVTIIRYYVKKSIEEVSTALFLPTLKHALILASRIHERLLPTSVTTAIAANRFTWQYILWVQRKKVKMVKESLSSSDGRKDGSKKTEEDLVEERWQVRTSRLLPRSVVSLEVASNHCS